jgi:hypothetical protein
MFEDVYGIVASQGSPDDPDNYTAGYSVLLDPVNCPDAYLGYCGMFVGVYVPPGTDPGTARAQILAEKNLTVGTPSAIIMAAQLSLSGTKSVILVERQGDGGPDAYWFQLIVRPEELNLGATWSSLNLPWSIATGTWIGGDQSIALKAAVNAVKPAGVFWTLVSTDGFTWVGAVHTWAADTFTWSQSSNTQP